MSDTDLPAPLVPAEVDLRDFQFMPLDVKRLRDSDLAAEEAPEACWAAVLLWCASWHQSPAASLPDNDRVLASLAGYGRVVAEWQKVRAGALRGWVKCSDGRLYHPVVAEKAVEAWSQRGEFREARANRETRQQRWRERIRDLSQRLRDRGITPPRGASLETLTRLLEETTSSTSASTSASPNQAPPSTQASTQASTVDAVEIGKRGRGTGTERETGTERSATAGGLGGRVVATRADELGASDRAAPFVAPPVASPGPKRATRLPLDWQLPKTWGEWAMAELGMDSEEVRKQAMIFGDYWVGLAGQKATKLDWAATWRNWCRRASAEKATRGALGRVSPGTNAAKPRDTAARNAKTAQLLGFDPPETP